MIHIKKPPVKSCLALLLSAVLAGSGLYTVNGEELSSGEISLSEPEDSSAEETSDTYQETPVITENEETGSASGVSASEPASSDNKEDSGIFSSGEGSGDLSSGESDEEPDYILGRPMTQQEYEAQLAPMKGLTAFAPEDDIIEDSSDTSAVGYSLENSPEYPESYDARKDNLITSVKNQLNSNNCWAFSLASNLETSLLSEGLGTWDLSEEHLAYFWCNRQDDPLGNTPDDKIIRTPSSSSNKGYHETGNGWVSSFFLSTWSGMTTEEEVPFSTSQQTYSSDLAYDTSAYMKNAVFSNYSENRMKELLTKYHSVSAMIYMDGSGTFYNASTAASCYPMSGLVNHAVTIVGWDDNYSKDNFSADSCVENNGAWIVKNSYGPNWGDQGYFYLSYEDLSIKNLLCNTAVTAPEYPNNYFYDGAATASFTQPLKKGFDIANVFTATAGGQKNEELGEIVLASKNDNSQYQIQVYTDLTDPNDPQSGTAAYQVPFDYTQVHAGIETVTLPEPVLIRAGSQFSVMITIVSDSISYYLEKSTTKSSWFKAVAGTSPQQSFISVGSGWNDMKTVNNSCLSIKAHTKTVDTPMPTPEPTATPTPTPDPGDEVTVDPEPETYRISYKSNTSLKAEGMPSSKSYTSGSSVTIPKAPVVRSRFFYGWNTKADGSGTYYSPGQKIRLRKNMTLYARWKTTYTSSGKLRYQVNGKYTVTCTGSSSSSISSVSIPDTIKYRDIIYKVTAVSARAFRKQSRITKLSVGKNVSVIGNSAFDQCKNLRNITLGSGLTKIQSNGFRNVRKGCVVRVPKKKYSAYRKLLQKYLSRISIKKY